MSLDLIAGVVIGHPTAGAGAVVSAPLNAYAEHWKDRVRDRLDRTRAAAEAKMNGQPLELNDRVAFKVLSEAAINDDELIADYLGGVLAGTSAEDDSGAAIVAQIGRLSAAQLRLHYVVYRELRRLWPSEVALNLDEESKASSSGVRFSVQDMAAVLGPRALTNLGAIVTPLVKEGLLHGDYRWGPDANVGWSLDVRPSAMGARLFLGGSGVSHPTAAQLLQTATRIAFVTDVPATPDASLMSPPKACS